MKLVKKSLAAITLSATVAAGAGSEPLPVYENWDVLTNTPQINATTFINRGVFSVNSVLPYDFQNTLNFTNFGLMIGNPGFDFRYINDQGIRKPAANIYVARGATIEASPTGLIFFPGGAAIPIFGLENPQLRLTATNIVHRGLLSVPNSGLVKIDAQTANLAGGLLSVEPIAVGADPSWSLLDGTNYFPAPGLFDSYWGFGDVTNLPVANLLQGANAQTPVHNVTNLFGSGATSWSLFNPLSFGLTNVVPGTGMDTNNVFTNIFKQSVFVSVPSTNINVNVQWMPTAFPPGTLAFPPMRSALVQLTAFATNIIDADLYQQNIFIFDQLASSTNFVLTTNLINPGMRPSAYVVARTPPFGFGIPVEANTEVTPDFFWDPTYTSMVATGRYAAYSAILQSLDPGTIASPLADITNLPGRIEIKAENLNLSRTRIRGETYVTVETDNLLGSEDANIDVEIIDLNLESKAGDLKVENLVKDTVDRLNGQILLWSGHWTNNFELVQMIDTNSVTSAVQVIQHTLFVNAFLNPVVPVTTRNFRAVANAEPSLVTVADNLSIINSFLVDAENLDVSGAIVLNGALRWNSDSVPRLENLTNSGTLSLSGFADFGGARRMSNVVNSGSINALSHRYNTDVLDNSGSIAATFGPIEINAGTVRLEDGQVTGGGEILLNASVLKMQGALIDAATHLHLNVDGALQDSGWDAGNTIAVGNGFRQAVRPVLGDLLGTTIESSVFRFDSVFHTWAAPNYPENPMRGFTNGISTPVGRLVLDGQVASQFIFESETTGNAIYVDQLVLTPEVFNDLDEALFIDGDFTIYFADITATPGTGPIPQSVLDRVLHPTDSAGYQPGTSEGRLVWVREFAGPNSGIDIVAAPGGVIVRKNRLERTSERLDSDGDGLPNAFDCFPYDGATRCPPQIQQVSAADGFSVSFDAWSGATFYLEYTTDVRSGEWTVLREVRSENDFEIVELKNLKLPEAAALFFRIRVDE